MGPSVAEMVSQDERDSKEQADLDAELSRVRQENKDLQEGIGMGETRRRLRPTGSMTGEGLPQVPRPSRDAPINPGAILTEANARSQAKASMEAKISQGVEPKALGPEEFKCYMEVYQAVKYDPKAKSKQANKFGKTEAGRKLNMYNKIEHSTLNLSQIPSSSHVPPHMPENMSGAPRARPIELPTGTMTPTGCSYLVPGDTTPTGRFPGGRGFNLENRVTGDVSHNKLLMNLQATHQAALQELGMALDEPVLGDVPPVKNKPLSEIQVAQQSKEAWSDLQELALDMLAGSAQPAPPQADIFCGATTPENKAVRFSDQVTQETKQAVAKALSSVAVGKFGPSFWGVGTKQNQSPRITARN